MTAVRARIHIILIVIWIALMGIAAFWQPHDPSAIDLDLRNAVVSWQHPLGTDHLGRDMLSRIMAGGWRTLLVLVIVSLLGFAIGSVSGMVAALTGGMTETIVLRLAELPIVIPTLVVAMAVASLFGMSPITAGLALGLAGLGPFALTAHALARRTMALTYMQAAEAIGASLPRRLVHHVVPAILPLLLTQAAGNAGTAVVAYAALAFLGLGADTSAPDWGAMLFEYRSYIFEDPALMIWPGAAIAVTVTLLSIGLDEGPA